MSKLVHFNIGAARALGWHPADILEQCECLCDNYDGESLTIEADHVTCEDCLDIMDDLYECEDCGNIAEFGSAEEDFYYSVFCECIVCGRCGGAESAAPLLRRLENE